MAWRSYHTVVDGRLVLVAPPGRILCAVPFCRRTKRKPDGAEEWEWICAQHWRLVDRSVRREHARLFRKKGHSGGVWDIAKEQAVARGPLEVPNG